MSVSNIYFTTTSSNSNRRVDLPFVLHGTCHTSCPQVCAMLVKEAAEAGASFLALPECFSFIGVSFFGYECALQQVSSLGTCSPQLVDQAVYRLPVYATTLLYGSQFRMYHLLLYYKNPPPPPRYIIRSTPVAPVDQW